MLRLASCSRCMVRFFWPLTIYCKYCPMFWWIIHTLSSFFGLMHKLTPLLSKDQKIKPKTTSSIGFLLVLIRSDLRIFTASTHHPQLESHDSRLMINTGSITCSVSRYNCMPHLSSTSVENRYVIKTGETVYIKARTFHLRRNRDAERCSSVAFPKDFKYVS